MKKTEDQIQTNFFWPGLHEDVTSFCQSCDVCQKTVARGSVPRAPLGDMPLIDQPFKRMTVDLVGPIASASNKGHRCILTLSGLCDKIPRGSAEEHRYRDGSRSVVRHVQSGWSTGGSSERPWNPVYIGLHEGGI